MNKPKRFQIWFTQEELDIVGQAAGKGNKEKFMKESIMNAANIELTAKSIFTPDGMIPSSKVLEGFPGIRGEK